MAKNCEKFVMCWRISDTNNFFYGDAVLSSICHFCWENTPWPSSIKTWLSHFCSADRGSYPQLERPLRVSVLDSAKGERERRGVGLWNGFELQLQILQIIFNKEIAESVLSEGKWRKVSVFKTANGIAFHTSTGYRPKIITKKTIIPSLEHIWARLVVFDGKRILDKVNFICV